MMSQLRPNDHIAKAETDLLLELIKIEPSGCPGGLFNFFLL